MLTSYSTPGVYVQEIPTLAPSVAPVATAIPVFIGYTEKGPTAPTRIDTLLDYENLFGGANPSAFSVEVNDNPIDKLPPTLTITRTDETSNPFLMYYGLSLYFQNGGGSCYILSIGDYKATPAKGKFEDALTALEKEDEPTLIVLLDAVALTATEADYYALCRKALDQCYTLGDRFLLVDIPESSSPEKFRSSSTFGNNYLSYAAAYYPYLNTTLNYLYKEEKIIISDHRKKTVTVTPKSDSVTWSSDISGITVSYTGAAGDAPTPSVTITADTVDNSDFDTSVKNTLTIKISSTKAPTAKDLAGAWSNWKTAGNSAKGFDIVVSTGNSKTVVTVAANQQLTQTTPKEKVSDSTKTESLTLAGLEQNDTSLYNQIKSSLANQRVTLPPSPAIAGVYASVDRDRGVWKSPANVSLNAVLGPDTKISDTEQDQLNIDPTAGKSINAIRSFTGKGTLVWGARTLAGNDNEWRYVSVRRLFINIEESTRKASAFAVFEPNDATTWLKVKAMIESYLYGLWQQGAMAGSKPESAYFVSVGLGKTMTAQDILEGRMIVNIGVAAVRPAEFIILCFSHKMQEA
jgi:phage tail sheath protein FI